MSEEYSDYSEGLWERTDDPKKWRRFMFHDWTNPSRYLAFYLTAEYAWHKEHRLSFAVIGFGDAWDFCTAWREMHDREYIDYVGYEIMPNFALYASVKFPDYDFREGGFMELEPGSYDITYTRHTFEHISPKLWRRCLVKLLRATKELCIVTWYMPPGNTRMMAKNWTDKGDYGLWQNRYYREDVLKIVTKMNFEPTVWDAGTNELWELRRVR